MEKKTAAKWMVGALLLAIGMWWTRYQVIGTFGGNSMATVVVNRFTGQLWIIGMDYSQTFGAHRMEWESTTVKEHNPAKEQVPAKEGKRF